MVGIQKKTIRELLLTFLLLLLAISALAWHPKSVVLPPQKLGIVERSVRDWLSVKYPANIQDSDEDLFVRFAIYSTPQEFAKVVTSVYGLSKTFQPSPNDVSSKWHLVCKGAGHFLPLFS